MPYRVCRGVQHVSDGPATLSCRCRLRIGKAVSNCRLLCFCHINYPPGRTGLETGFRGRLHAVCICLVRERDGHSNGRRGWLGVILLKPRLLLRRDRWRGTLAQRRRNSTKRSGQTQSGDGPDSNSDAFKACGIRMERTRRAVSASNLSNYI